MPHRDNRKEKEIKKSKFGTFTRIWSVLYLISLIAFLGMIIYTDMLPAKYLYSALAIIGVISLLIFPMLYFRNIKKGRKIFAFILSLILMAGFVYGIVNLRDTVNFFSKVTTAGGQTKDYYVVVRDNSNYQDIEELSGQMVGTYLTNDKDYSRAKGKMQSRVDVEFTMAEALSEMDDGLYDKNYEALLLSKSQYHTMSEKEENFDEQTRVLYTIRLAIDSKNLSKRVDVSKEPFNIYISGLDISGSISETSRSDVNMIVTVNPVTHRVLLTSIPRDYEIHLPSYDNEVDKLTHTGIYGIEETVGAVENLTGLDMNYYVKVNYTTVKKLIKAIGGIDVHNDIAFSTHGMMAQYYFEEGDIHLDGDMALAFARERKSFEDGDVQRNRNQTKVMEAVIDKATSSTTILTKYNKILKSCQKYIEMNLTQDDIKKLVKLQMNGGYHWTIDKQSMEGESVTETVYSSGDYLLYVMQPTEEQIVKAVDQIITVMDGGEAHITESEEPEESAESAETDPYAETADGVK